MVKFHFISPALYRHYSELFAIPVVLNGLQLMCSLFIAMCENSVSFPRDNCLTLLCCRLLGSTSVQLQEVISKGRQNISPSLTGKKGDPLRVSIVFPTPIT